MLLKESNLSDTTCLSTYNCRKASLSSLYVASPLSGVRNFGGANLRGSLSFLAYMVGKKKLEIGIGKVKFLGERFHMSIESVENSWVEG